jgi:hypothetical protein
MCEVIALKEYQKCKTCEFCSKSGDHFICEFDGNNYAMADNEGDCENHSYIAMQ